MHRYWLVTRRLNTEMKPHDKVRLWCCYSNILNSAQNEVSHSEKLRLFPNPEKHEFQFHFSGLIEKQVHE
jgi:hypothetical protein